MAGVDREQLAELLSAYLDDELDTEETSLVERALREDEGARRLLAELRRTVALVSALPVHSAPPSVAEDVRARIERAELLGGLDEPQPVLPRGRSPAAVILSMAAMLAVVAVGVWYLRDRAGGAAGVRENVVALAQKDREEELREEIVPKHAQRRDRPAAPARSNADIHPDATTDKGRKRPAKRAKTKRRAARAPSGEAVTKGTAYDRPSAGAMPRPVEARLLATANIEQKLASGVDVARLRGHAFANEPVHLEITVHDKEERDAVTAKMLTSLSQHRVADLFSARLGSVRGRKPVSGRFYYQGKPGMNFDEPDQSQILLRLTPRELDGLFGQLARVPGVADRVALRAGPLEVRGLDNVRRALGAPEQTPQTLAGRGGQARISATSEAARIGVAGEEEGTTTDRDVEKAERKGLYWGLSDLARIAGFDPDSFAVKSSADQKAGLDEDINVEAEGSVEQTAPAKEVAVPAEPSSLVDRRLEELEKSRRGRGAGKGSASSRWKRPSPADAGGELRRPPYSVDSTDQSDGRFVTFVVQLTVAKRDADRPSRSRPKPLPGETAKPKPDRPREKAPL